MSENASISQARYLTVMLMGRIVGWDSTAAEMQGHRGLQGGRILRRTTEEEWRRRLACLNATGFACGVPK
jgi:hypothetical protein